RATWRPPERLEPALLHALSSGATLEFLQEAQDGVAHFGGALLLRPVTAARQDRRASELGHETRQVGDELIHPRKGDDEVAIARDVEGRYHHARAGVRSKQLPVAIDISIPVEAAAEARVGKLAREHVDVGARDPPGKHLGRHGAVEYAALLRHHRPAKRAPDRDAREPFSRKGIEKPAEGCA